MLHFLRPLLLTSLAQICVVQVSFAKEPDAEAKMPRSSSESTQTRDNALPEATPYDSDAKERTRYLRGYRDGRDWALQPDRHDHATTNPNGWNGAAIRGFVEGWKAGVRSAPAGTPTGDLPSKYARLITWDQAEADAFVAEQKPASRPKPNWDEIRTARIKAHDGASATEFAGRWKLTLPRGAIYDIELARGEGPQGLLQMKAARSLCMLGGYSLKGDRLQLVAPKDGDSAQDFDWQYRDGVFVLESHTVRNGGHYVGATLERMKGLAAP